MKCVEEPITGEYKYKGVIVDVRLDKARSPQASWKRVKNISAVP